MRVTKLQHSLLLLAAALTALAVAAPAAAQARMQAAATAAPIVLYTDIVSGPNSGGENDKGAYL